MASSVLVRSLGAVALVVLLIALPSVLSAVPDLENGTYYGYEGSTDAVLEREPPQDRPIGSARGEVLFRGNESNKDVYVRLGEEGELSYELVLGELEQGPVTIDVPVNWTQRATITAEENVTVNLWNHNESIADSFLTDVVDMEIRLGGELISEVPIFSVPAGTHELELSYTTPAVRREVVCRMQTVSDLLPPGAELIDSDLPLDTIVQEVCQIRLYHESHTPYRGVSFDVPEIDEQEIISIYSVEQDEYLYLKDGSLYVPE